MSRAPALIFVSKVDPMGTEDFNEKIAEIWRANGVNVTYKCFENSPHVKHYQVHPEEYLKHLHDLWKLVKLLERNWSFQCDYSKNENKAKILIVHIINDRLYLSIYLYHQAKKNGNW